MTFPHFEPCPLCGEEVSVGWEVVPRHTPEGGFYRQCVVAAECPGCGLRLERRTERVYGKEEHLRYMAGLAKDWNRRAGQ